MLIESINRIRLLIEREKFDVAQQKIVEGLSHFPDSSDLHALQAELHLERSKPNEALQAIEKAIGLDPENDWWYYIASRIYSDKNEEKKALEFIDIALAMDPNYGQYYGFKAAILLDLNKRDDSIALAREGLAIEPDNVICHNVIALALNKAGDKESAFEHLDFLLSEDPENALTHANMGNHYLRQSNIPKAKEHFAIALQKDPNFEFARLGMIEAIKSSNVLYQKLMEYSFWVEQKFANGGRWKFYIGLIVVVKILPFLLPFYFIFLFWSWFMGPISDVMLYFDKYGRYLMREETVLFTRVNIGLLVLAAISAFILMPLLSLHFLGTAVGLFLATVPTYLMDISHKNNKRLFLVVSASIFIGLGILGGIMGIAQPEFAFMIWVVLFLYTMIFSWASSAAVD